MTRHVIEIAYTPGNASIVDDTAVAIDDILL